MQINAHEVFTAAQKTFADYGDKCYAKYEAHSFLRRCGVKKLETFTRQTVELDAVKNAVFVMLDSNSENLFWKYLEEATNAG